MTSFYIIDGHALLYQSFYAIGEMTGPGGQSTNAIYGFMATLLKICKEKAPTHLAVAFDHPGPTFRHEMYDAYKAQRKEIPQELAAQIDPMMEILDAMEIPVFSVSGVEADDVIGTLTKLADEQVDDVVIVSRDKDAKQLLSEWTRMYDSRKDEYLDLATLADTEKIAPAQMVDVLALAGDTSDNIPGVPGVGPKTALMLIQQYGDLESVLAAAPEMRPSKRRDALIAHADDARLSRQLATIKRDVPLNFDLDACRTSEGDRERLLRLLSSLGLRRFIDALAAPDKEETDERRYRAARTHAEIEALAVELRGVRRLSVDLETTSINPIAADIVGVSLAWREREAVYIPVRCVYENGLPDVKETLGLLAPILSDPKIEKVGQNIKYDLLVFGNYDVELSPIGFDSMVASYLLDPGRRRHNINELAMDHLGIAKIATADLLGKGKNQRRMDEVPLETVTEYACEDADVALRLAGVLEPKIEEAGLSQLLHEIELPLIRVLAELERNGVALDVAYLEVLSVRMHQRLDELEREIHALAGAPFNIDSPKQLSKVLFEDMGLAPIRKTKTGYSTDSSVLTELSRDHELPRAILEYRRIAKLLGTYVDTLPKMIVPRTGRVHTSFNQTVTATGRISSSDPNLQNIPVRTEIGREIRRAFVPAEPGNVLLTADYSQIELRVLAHLSGDPALMAAFEEDQDIHRAVAAEIFDVPIPLVTDEMRARAKAVNFGVIYGQTAYGLSKSVGIGIHEADVFISDYFARYPGVAAFIDKTLDEARERGYVTTLCNRRRYITGIPDERSHNLNLAERTAVNTRIQGSAADMIKLAMIQIHHRIKNEARPSRMLLQIHDELVFEMPADAAPSETEMIRREMVDALALAVPVKVDIAVGENWLEAK